MWPAQTFRGDDSATLEFSGSSRALLAQSDRMSAGGTLEELWKSGRQGNLCPLEQVRAIALRDAGWVGQMKAPFGGGAPIQWRGEGADHFYPTMSDI